jgi:predicted Rossmann fold flavoprotein
VVRAAKADITLAAISNRAGYIKNIPDVFQGCFFIGFSSLYPFYARMSRMNKPENVDVAIIGGGAAGLMAAAAAIEANPDAEIVLIERNSELGKKVKISGGGRCNVTTGIRDIKTVLQKYPRGGKFLISSMHAFPPSAMMEWVESHGVPLKVEEDLRVFPCSNRGEDIVEIFERLFERSRIEVLLNASVSGVRYVAGAFGISLKDGTEIIAKRIVITTGGQAYRQTGSTGDGYAFAQSLGHTVTPLAPSLSSLMTKETWPAELSGLSFPYAFLSAPSAKANAEGAFLFTHKGISGPAVFALSSQLAFTSFDAKHPMELFIDLFPNARKEELFENISGLIEKNPKKRLPTILSFMIPKSFSEIVCTELKLTEDRNAVEISKKERMNIADWLKEIPLHALGRGAGDEFVTAGGIDLSEVDPKTMESKRTPGLYLAGEVLDIDGYTGGFNLQASWATGRAAGSNAVLPKSSPSLSPTGEEALRNATGNRRI